MLQEVNSPQSSSATVNSDARDRVRKMLSLRPDPSADEHDTSPQELKSHNDDDDEDEIVAPRPRKLQQRRLPSATPQADENEPGALPKPLETPSGAPHPILQGCLCSSPIQPRSPSTQSHANDSESDPDLPSLKNPRFKELVARKRRERLAREAEEEEKRQARLALQQAEADLMADDGDDSNDYRRRRWQDPHPEIAAAAQGEQEGPRGDEPGDPAHDEKSLQLAHEAKTKRKITKASLFERFNFKPQGGAGAGPNPSSSKQTCRLLYRRTAPTPRRKTPRRRQARRLTPAEKLMKGRRPPRLKVPLSVLNNDDDDLPTLAATLEPAAKESALDKGKATAADLDQPAMPVPKARRNVRVKLPAIDANLVTLASDDELEIQPAKGKTKIDAILDRVPVTKAKESRPMYILRRLANLDDPDKKGSAPTGKGKRITQPAMTAVELQMSLVQRAREQAKLERDRRLELLKSKGIHVPTEEERERERAEVEDIVARARQEAEEIMLREREAAKKERKESEEADPLALMTVMRSDNDYEEETEEPESKVIELSGSEDEDEEMKDDEDLEHEENGSANGGLIDDAAHSDAESETPDGKDFEDDSHSTDEEVVPLQRPATRRPKKHATIISDDESDHRVEATPRPKIAHLKSPSALNAASPSEPSSVLRSATKTFLPGLPVTGPAGLGLMQIFAGTMDDSQGWTARRDAVADDAELRQLPGLAVLADGSRGRSRRTWSSTASPPKWQERPRACSLTSRSRRCTGLTASCCRTTRNSPTCLSPPRMAASRTTRL